MSVGLLAGDSAMPLHCSCYIITSLLFFVTRGLTGWCSCHASPFSTSLPLLGFISQHSCCASPFHSSGHLLHLYLFYSHELFAKSFGLPQPNYHILTSYYFFGLIGLEANPIDLLIHFLGFPGPFTSYLPLIVPIGLLLHSLGFLDPFTSSLPLIILVGLLAIIPIIPACWVYFTIFSSHFLYIVGLLLLSDLSVKSGYQQEDTTIFPNWRSCISWELQAK